MKSFLSPIFLILALEIKASTITVSNTVLHTSISWSNVILSLDGFPMISSDNPVFTGTNMTAPSNFGGAPLGDMIRHNMSDILTNASATSVTVQTNWIAGKWYTNSTTREWQVSMTITNSSILVNGQTGYELWVGYSTNAAPFAASSSAASTALIGGLIVVTQPNLTASVPCGGYFCFTNQTTGIGNAATPKVLSGQWTIR